MPYFVFEGIDGSGTTTQSKRLYEEILSLGRSVSWVCEPTDKLVGRFVRSVLEAEKLPNWRTMTHLFQADREDHYVSLRKLLKAGEYVISDRSWLSSLVYQMTSAEAAAEDEEAEKLITYLNEQAPIADITFILDVEVKEALQRKGKPNLYENEKFLKKVRERYQMVRGRRIRRIDTTTKSAEEVYQEIDRTLREEGF